MWIWNPGKFPSFCTVENVQFYVHSIGHFGWLSGIYNFLRFHKNVSSLELLNIFVKTVHQKGLFDAMKENPNFPTCRWILHIYWQRLLNSRMYINK